MDLGIKKLLGNQIKNTVSGVEIAEQHCGCWGGERRERREEREK